MKNVIILLVIVCTLSAVVSAQSPKKYSAQEIQDDLKYLYETLEKTNYDLYARVKKEEMDRAYQEIYSSIKDSLTVLETFRLFQPFVAMSGMSHCFVFKPWGDYMNVYLKQGGTVFPLMLYFSQGKVFVKDNFSSNKAISKSDEILSFNEIPIDQYMTEFCKALSGPSEYYKKSLIERSTFPRLFWLYNGECKDFKVRVRNKDGNELDVVLNAISGSYYEEQLKEFYSDTDEEREFRQITNTLAYLRPDRFLKANSNYDLKEKNTFDNSAILLTPHSILSLKKVQKILFWI